MLSILHWPMRLNRFSGFVSIGLLLGLVSCGPVSDSHTETNTLPDSETKASVETATNTLVIGDISKNDPVRSIEAFQPLADYLAVELANMGIENGKVKVAPDMDTMSQWLATGEVDVYFDSAYPALRLAKEIGAKPILRRWKKGDAEYHSVIFTLQDSGIESMEDLSGSLIALDSPYSTSGYMLPMYYLLEANLRPVEKTSLESAVANDELGYVFTYNDENTLQWVVNGSIDAGIADNQAFAELPEDVIADMRILLETESVPRHIAVAAPDLEQPLMDAIIQVLLEVDKSEEGKAVLAQFEGTAKFDHFPTPNYLERLQEIFARVNDWSEE